MVGKGALVVRDPDDGAVVGEVGIATAAEIERALAIGHAAVRGKRLPAHERSRILAKVAAGVVRESDDYARLIATEGVKTIREAEAEVARCAITLGLAAEEAKRIGGGIVPFDQVASGQGRIGWFGLEPAGLVVAMTPFNDPLNLVAHKLGAAFALGAPIILKPHPQTPFSALRLVDAFHGAGAPAPMIQIVIGGADVGTALVADDRPRIVSFTGGRPTAAVIAKVAGLKTLLMELGGTGVVAVAADADLDRAADAIHSGAFWAAGQNCVHAQRIIADTRIVGGLRDRLALRAGAMTLGCKRDPATDMGPLVDVAAVRRMREFVLAAKAEGGRTLTGGDGHGTHFLPTWVDGVPSGHRLLRQEIFGPISTIEVAADDGHLLHLLASAGDAIHAAIFTGAIDTAMTAYRVANAGALIVNDSTDFRIDAMPFGGSGMAGLGREGIADAVQAMAEKKLFILNGMD